MISFQWLYNVFNKMVVMGNKFWEIVNYEINIPGLEPFYLWEVIAIFSVTLFIGVLIAKIILIFV